jgi:hypothetical protein
MGGDGRSRATEVFGAGGAAYLQTPPQARTSRAGEPFFSYDGAVRIGGVVTHASVNGGGRRARGSQCREYVIKVKLSAAEKESLAAAAGRAGLAPAAYLARAGLDAAEHRAVPVPVLWRDMLAEMVHASGLVRRAGVNLNQAVAKFNATGQPGPDLEPSVAYCLRVARHLDEVAVLVRRMLR